MFEASPELLNYIAAFIGIFFAVVFRTLEPYFQKLQENPDMAFRWIFVVNAVISGVGTGVVILLAFPMPEVETWKMIIIAFVFAYTGDDLLNTIMKGKGTTTLRYTTKNEKLLKKVEKLEDIENRVDTLTK